MLLSELPLEPLCQDPPCSVRGGTGSAWLLPSTAPPFLQPAKEKWQQRAALLPAIIDRSTESPST